jgi:hypothetical protein
MIFVLGIIGLGMTAFYSKTIYRKLTKFKNLVQHYQNSDNTTRLPTAFYLALCLVIKCWCMDIYHGMTSFSTKKFVFIKYVQGGNLSLAILPIKSGPKSNLEYAFIDGKSEMDLVSSLAGLKRDFSGHPEALLEFGNHIRYKFMDQDECSIQRGCDSEENAIKNKENHRKIKNLMWIYS